jgi:hypothetical protein
MKSVAIALACSGLVCLGSAAAAKPPQWDNAPQAEARKTAAQVARCMVAAHPQEVGAALDSSFGDSAWTARLAPILRDCMDAVVKPRMPTQPSQLTFPKLLLRGLLYEAMYTRTFARSSSPKVFDATLRAMYPAVAEAATPPSLAHDYPALMRIGECAVRAGPAQARALILTDVASKAEEAALAAFQPAWTACLSGRRQLSFSIEMIRGSIAEPLYRLTQRSARTAEAAE